MEKEIRHSWHYNHSPERVWDCLTDSRMIAQWLMDNDFKPVVGHKFMFTHNPLPQFGFSGKIYCEVLEVVPCQRLVYSWKGGPKDGEVTLDSLVTWTLTPSGDGTDLHLVHSGFREGINDAAYPVMNKGWDDNCSKRFVTVLNEPTHEPSRH